MEAKHKVTIFLSGPNSLAAIYAAISSFVHVGKRTTTITLTTVITLSINHKLIATLPHRS